MCLKWLVKSLNPFFLHAHFHSHSHRAAGHDVKGPEFSHHPSLHPPLVDQCYSSDDTSLGGRMCVGKVVCITELHINDDT